MDERDRIYTSIWNSYKFINSTRNFDLYAFLSSVHGDNATYDGNLLVTSTDADLPFLLDLEGISLVLHPLLCQLGACIAIYCGLTRRFSMIEIEPDGAPRTLNISYNGQGCTFQTVQNLTDPLSCDPSNITFTPDFTRIQRFFDATSSICLTGGVQLFE